MQQLRGQQGLPHSSRGAESTVPAGLRHMVPIQLVLRGVHLNVSLEPGGWRGLLYTGDTSSNTSRGLASYLPPLQRQPRLHDGLGRATTGYQQESLEVRILSLLISLSALVSCLLPFCL